MLTLPKNLNDHPRLDKINALFTAEQAPLWAEGKILAPRWAFDAAVQRALREVARSEHVSQGLDAIARELDRELKGLQAALPKHAVAPSPRLSRLLLLSQDGAERFYRDAESLLHRHADRAMAVVIAANADQIGQAIVAKGPVKALLINDKTALGAFLATLVNEPA